MGAVLTCFGVVGCAVAVAWDSIALGARGSMVGAAGLFSACLWGSGAVFSWGGCAVGSQAAVWTHSACHGLVSVTVVLQVALVLAWAPLDGRLLGSHRLGSGPWRAGLMPFWVGGHPRYVAVVFASSPWCWWAVVVLNAAWGAGGLPRVV